MRSSDLTPAQLRKFRDSLRPKLQYLTAVKNRMEATQFRPSDRMYRDVKLAEQVLSDLLLEVETYLSYKRETPEPFR